MPEGARFENTEKADEQIFKNDGRYCLSEPHCFSGSCFMYRNLRRGADKRGIGRF